MERKLTKAQQIGGVSGDVSGGVSGAEPAGIRNKRYG